MNQRSRSFIPHFLIVVLILTVSVQATDRTQFYDYSGNGNNVTAANNGAAYNTTDLKQTGINGYTFDGSNDYLTITPGAGINGLCSFNAASNWTVAILANFPRSSGSGQTIFKMCHDDTGNGSGYLFKFNLPSDRMAIQNGSTTVQGVNTSIGLTYNEWAWYFYTMFANGTLVMEHNMTAQYNSTLTGMAANLSVTDNSTVGAQNGGAQRFTGTVGQILVYKRSLSYAQKLNISNGSEGGLAAVNTQNLTMNLAFRNQTSANGSVDQNSFNRNVPTNTFGYHIQASQLSCFGQLTPPGGTSLGTTRNCALDQTLMLLSGAKSIRAPTHGGNSVSAVNIISATNVTLTYRTDTGAGVQERNINHWRQGVSFAANNSMYYFIHFEETPEQLANNSSPLCSYGANASNRNSCMPYNYTLYTQYMARFIVDIGCFNYTNPVCVVSPSRNEPYNPGSTHFWLDNASCTQRSSGLIALWNNSGRQAVNTTLASWGYNTSKIVGWSGPSFADTSSSGTACSQDMEQNFSTAFPPGSANSPTWQETHLYCYDADTCDLTAQYVSWQTRMDNRGYNASWGITEGGVLDHDDNFGATLLEKVVMEQSHMGFLSETKGQFKTDFQATYYDTVDTNEEGVAWFNSQFVNSSTKEFNRTYGKYDATRTIALIPAGAGIYDCNMNTTASTCLYAKVNSTLAYIMITNRQANQLDVDSVNISGFTATSATRMVQGRSMYVNTTETVTAGKLDPSPIYPYGSAVFAVVGTTSDLSASQYPAYLINTTEPSNVTMSIILTNPSGLPYTVDWFRTTGGSPIVECDDLLNCTMVGNYSSAGQYNWSARVTSTNTGVVSNYTWLVQVNNTIRNLSVVVTPSGSTVSIEEANDYTFSIVVTDPDSTMTSRTWRKNGTNQTAYYNTNSYVFDNNYSAAGTYNISIWVVGSQNTIKTDWTLTVIDAATPDQCGTFGHIVQTMAPITVMVVDFVIISAMWTNKGRRKGEDDNKFMGRVMSVIFVSIIISYIIIRVWAC